jgi:hypothetical protein
VKKPKNQKVLVPSFHFLEFPSAELAADPMNRPLFRFSFQKAKEASKGRTRGNAPIGGGSGASI